MKKRILSLTLASTLLISNASVLAADSSSLEDVEVNKPYINGYADGSFKPMSYVNRAEVAKMIAVIESLEASATTFPDVGEEHAWAKEFIGSAEKAGILKGDQLGNFRPQDGLTRAEMATIVSRVIKTPTENSGAVFSDISNHWAEADIIKVANAGIINGYPGDDSTFTPDGFITRQEAVKMLNGMMGRIFDPEIANKVDNPYSDIANEWGFKHILAAGTDYKYIVTSDGVDHIITASDEASGFISIGAYVSGSNEITIEGLKLNNMKLSDIKVDNNEVKSIKVSADGTSAVVELKTILEPGKETKVVVNQSGTSKTYIVKYELSEENIEVIAGTFDQNKKGQTIGVKLDGIVVSIDSLKAAGYSLKFETYNGNESANYQVFGSADASTTGIIGEQTNNAVLKGKYDVVVTLSKGDLSVTSKRATINIVDLNIEATSIKSVTLLNDSGKGNHDGAYAFEQVSNTLVVGEELKIDEVIAIVGREEVKLGDGAVSVDSSDNAIEIEGTDSNRRIVAKGVGEAKVTVSVGKAQKVYDLKVVNEDRVETKVEAINKTNGIILGKESVAKVKITDQYGDPIRVFGDDTKVTYPVAVELSQSSSVQTGATEKLNTQLGSVDKKGVANLSLGSSAKEGQTGTVIVKDEKGTIIGNIFVRSESSEIKSRKLEIDTNSEVKTSDNNVLSLTNSKKDSITYVVKGYNSYGTYINDADLNDYVVEYNQADFDVELLDSNGVIVGDATINTAGRIQGAGVVKVKLVAKNTTNNTIVTVYSASRIQIGKENLKIEGSQSILQGIKWKAENIVLSDANVGYVIDKDTVLSLTNAITSGGNQSLDGLVVSGSQAAYPKRVRESAGKLAIYLDKNNNGFYETGDEMIGFITMNLDDVTGVTKGTGFTASVTSTNATGKVVYELRAINADGTEGSVISSTSVTFSGNIEQSLISLEKDASAILTNVDTTLNNSINKGNIDKTIQFGVDSGLTVSGTTVTPAKGTFVSNHTETTLASLDTLITELGELESKASSASLKEHYNSLKDRATEAKGKLEVLDKTIFDLTYALVLTRDALDTDANNTISLAGVDTAGGGSNGKYQKGESLDVEDLAATTFYAAITDSKASGVWSVDGDIKGQVAMDTTTNTITIAEQVFNKVTAGKAIATITFEGANGKNYIFIAKTAGNIEIEKSVVVEETGSNLYAELNFTEGASVETSLSLSGVTIDGVQANLLSNLLAKIGANPTVTVTGNPSIASAKIDIKGERIVFTPKTTETIKRGTVEATIKAANGQIVTLTVEIY